MKKLILLLIACTTLITSPCDARNPIVEIDTTMGKIVVELFEKERPKTVANFLKYVDEGFYDDTIFHRVIPNFMVQGGGFESIPYLKQPYASIPNESSIDILNKKGTIAMARKRDLNSANSQFFINTQDNPFLDTSKYAVFGKVILGMDTVKKIEAVKTKTIDGFDDVPIENITIKKTCRLAIPVAKAPAPAQPILTASVAPTTSSTTPTQNSTIRQ